MKKLLPFFNSLIILWLINLYTHAQTLPGNYTTTWAGNSFSGSPDWVQGYMYSAGISPDGKVFTISHWDEAHKECGIYKDGRAIGRIATTGFAITDNSSNIFAASGSTVKKYNFEGKDASQTINTEFSPDYLAANKKYLVASGNSSNSVAVFNLKNGVLIKKWTVKDPGSVAIDSANNVWVVSGVKLPEDRFERKWLVYDSIYTPRIFKYNYLGVKQADSVFMYDEWKPVCINFDKNTNQLMVGDDGPVHQVNFFDIEESPSLVKSFGTEGGISAGDPGIITPTKFWALKGIGTDTAGNIYVIISEDGSVIRSFAPGGELNWELNAANFVDVMNFDQYSDGRFLYGKNEIIEMEYYRTDPGEEWRMHAYTQDRTKYPDDPRNFYSALGHEFTSVWPRIIEGDLYMFTAGMYGIKPNVFKFSGKVASPAAYLKLNGSSAFFQDREGSVWEANGSGILKTSLMTIEKNGDLVYGKVEKVSNIPVPFNSVSRIFLDEENDIMYLTGNDNKIARYNNWSTGNRTPLFTGIIPASYNQSVAVAGDYIFTCGVQTKARVKIYSAADFTYMGELLAGTEVGGVDNTGWVDIPYGLNAIKRSNGEYIIAVEDDYKGKSIIFRWCPAGTCMQGPPSVQFNGLVNKTTLLPGESLEINVTASDNNGTIDSLEVYADTTLLAATSNETLSYNWQNITEGNYYLLAKAYDNDGLMATTYPVRIYVSTPDITKPSVPNQLGAGDTATTYVTLFWNQSADDISLAGYKILRDGEITYVSGGSDTSFIATGLLPDSSYNFSVVAFDKALNLSDTSNIITVKTKSDGPYLSSPMPIPGIIEMEYFDYGGEGVSYHDAEPEHIGDPFRSDEGVDIATTDNGGYYVGWNEINEWLRFTVDVAKEGDYDVVFTSAGGGGSINLNFSNGDKNFTADYVSSGDWNIWKINARTNIHLLPGIQYLTVTYNNNQFNLDYFNIIDHQTENLQIPFNLELDTIILKSATLKWNMDADVTNIKEYKIYKDGKFLETSPTRSYVAKSLKTGQTYEFTVSSVSIVGIESEKSNVVSVLIPFPTSVNQQLTGDILIYPNPAKDFITIKTWESFGENLSFTVTDLCGQTCISKKIENIKGEFTQSVNTLSKGMYLLEIRSDKKCITKTLLVE